MGEKVANIDIRSDPCDKHDDCIGRIHDRITNIEKAMERGQGTMEGFTTTVKDFLEEIRKDVYSKGGLIERAGTQGNQVFLQWGLMAAIVVAVVISFVVGK